MKYLKPILNKKEYSRIIRNIIFKYFEEMLFSNIEDIWQYYFEDKVLFNAKITELEKALRNYKIEYRDNRFIGKFNAKISKELRDLGAKFDIKTKEFFVESSILPKRLKNLIQNKNENILKFKNELNSFLDESKENIRNSNIEIDFNNDIKEILKDLDNQFKSSTLDYIIIADLKEKIKNKIAKNYTNNINLYIKDFTIEQITDLRKQMNKLVLRQGLRAEAIKDILKEKYNITNKKAKFLATQENNLLVSQYRQQRYEDIGLNLYVWRTAEDSKVRSTHKKLDNKIFDYSMPPMIDGKRVNPGEDFGCRCLAIPVISDAKFIKIYNSEFQTYEYKVA